VTNRLTERQNSWLILLGLWLLLLLLAGIRPLAVPDEGRYGEIGRWMLESGDWLTPRLNGIPFFHKPPYVYWLEAASLATFGVSAWSLRLVAALHAGLMLVTLYLAARAIASESIARRAVLMLGTSLSFLVGGQYVNHDTAVAAWIGVAIGCFAFAFMAADRPHAHLARLGFAACAFGMLSKGLIGIALPGMVLLIWLVATRQLKKVLYLPWFSGLALFVLISAPWFVIAQQKYPQLLDYMFINHHFKRYTATSFNNPQPVWFYLAAVGLLFFPWVFLALRQLRYRGPSQTTPEPMARPWWLLCWIWVLAILLFFSIPNSKLVGYILPVMPPLALLAALGWERAMARRPAASRIFAGVCGLNLVIALVALTQVGGVTRTGRSEDLSRVLACAARPSDTIYVMDGYPYDLPPIAQTNRPLVVLADWPSLRKRAHDGWQRELFEGAEFDAQAAAVLQSPAVLAEAGRKPGNWFVARTGNRSTEGLAGWKLSFKGAGWVLYQSGADLAPEGPKTAEHKGLPGCDQQR